MSGQNSLITTYLSVSRNTYGGSPKETSRSFYDMDFLWFAIKSTLFHAFFLSIPLGLELLNGGSSSPYLKLIIWAMLYNGVSNIVVNIAAARSEASMVSLCALLRRAEVPEDGFIADLAKYDGKRLHHIALVASFALFLCTLALLLHDAGQPLDVLPSANATTYSCVLAAWAMWVVYYFGVRTVVGASAYFYIFKRAAKEIDERIASHGFGDLLAYELRLIFYRYSGSVVTFWFIVAVMVSTSITLYADFNSFVVAVLGYSVLVSLGFGSIVYFASELHIKKPFDKSEILWHQHLDALLRDGREQCEQKNDLPSGYPEFVDILQTRLNERTKALSVVQPLFSLVTPLIPILLFVLGADK